MSTVLACAEAAFFGSMSHFWRTVTKCFISCWMFHQIQMVNSQVRTMWAEYRTCLSGATLPKMNMSRPWWPATEVLTEVTGRRTTQEMSQIGISIRTIMRKKRTKK